VLLGFRVRILRTKAATMIVYQDLLCDKDVASDSYPRKEEAKGAIIALESKKITVGDSEDAINKAIGANESKEEAGEKMDEAKDTVINIVHAHGLVKVDMTVKEFKATQAQYWKNLKNFFDKKRYAALGYEDNYKAPAKKEDAAAADAKALGKLDKEGKAELAVWDKRMALFKTHYTALTDFCKNEIEKNFEEFEFYIPAEAELGACLLIPARYVGEALSPTFYLWFVGILEAKF